MNWEAAGAIGEIVGGLAVVLTLGYLALQMKQNTISMKVAAKQEMTKQFSDYVDLLLSNPEYRLLNRRGMNGEHLDDDDKVVFNLLMSKAAWYFASMHYQYDQHSLSEEEWGQSKVLIDNYCSSPGFKTYWDEQGYAFSNSFRRHIEAHWTGT